MYKDINQPHPLLFKTPKTSSKIFMDFIKFVKSNSVFSVRDYKRKLRLAKQKGSYNDLPLEAADHFEFAWKNLLDGASSNRYLTFYEALETLLRIQIRSQKDFMSLKATIRRALRLPRSMYFYGEFKGWVHFKKELCRPNYESFKALLAQQRIKSAFEYNGFYLKEGIRLGLPKSPAIHFKGKWRGWNDVLYVEPMTMKRRYEIMQNRAAKRTRSKYPKAQ